MGISSRFYLKFFKVRLWLNAFFLAGFTVLLNPVNSAQASLLITAVDGASATESLGSATATPIIYGGISGALIGGCTALSSSSTCNNCTAADLACNESRIHGSLELQITVKVTAAITGTAYIWAGYVAATDQNLTSVSNPVSATPVTTDSVMTFSINWSELCPLANATEISGGCVANDPGDEGTVTLYVGVGDTEATARQSGNRRSITVKILNPGYGAPRLNSDEMSCTDGSPTQGICGFIAYPGDEKVYIADLEIINSCPPTMKYFRVFYSDDVATHVTGATYASPRVDLPLGTDCAPSGSWTVTGLTNLTSYYFRGAMVDVARNVFFLIDDADILAAQSDCGDSDPADDDINCHYLATPGTVIGLLPEDFNCFVATAAYGTGFERKLKELRRFRNRFLLKNSFGKKFVDFYYRVGPKAAKYISDKPFLRGVTRAALQPLWGFAWMALHYGFSGAVLWLLTLLGFGIYGIRKWRASNRLLRGAP